MNVKRAVLAAVAVFVAMATLSFVIHGLLLKPHYQVIPQLLRTEADANAHFQFLLLSFVCYSVGFVLIYAQGVERKSWLGQGLRYGFLVWLVSSLTSYLTWYAVQPWPGHITALQIVYELVMTLILGVIVSAMYRAPAA